MLNDDYPKHPGQTHAEPYYCTIPLEEYESLKDEISHLRSLNECMRAELEKRGVIVVPPSAELDKYEKEWVEAERKAVGQIIPYYQDKFCSRCGKPLDEKKWHKFSEELPNEDDYYLVTNGDFVSFEFGCYNEQDKEWNWDHYGKWKWWMPLPEPPKEDT